jgi:DNA-binding MarR family transcriptional regulator
MQMQSPSHYILDSIRRIVQALRVSSRAAERDLGLSSPQLFVLHTVQQAEGLSINEIAERTLTHQSSVSVLVSRLEEKGMLSKRASAEDARRTEIMLTAEGRAALRKTPHAAQEQIVRAIATLSISDQNQLASLLGAIVSQAGLETGPAPLFFEDDSSKGDSK